MNNNQKDVKDNDKTANLGKDDRNRNIPDKKSTDVKSDGKRGDMKKDGDKKSVSTNKK